LAISTALLYLVGTTDVRLFALFMGMIGFTLYGPDAMLTSTGAIDVGPRKNAALAAGIISGFGSMGPVVQEVLLGRQLNDGDVGAVARMLFASALGALLSLSVLLVRTRRGSSRL
jgi:sugar phosphate permease